jgi:CRISPR-associated protein Cmr2
LGEYYDRQRARQILERTRRPVGPALHAAISEALTNFATRIAPGIVSDQHGELIYAGGDDLLALLPTEAALTCAARLESAFRGLRDANGGAAEGYFRGADGVDRLVMGPNATLSAGIAVVHHKEDLRAALELARKAERSAKRAGRNRLHLFIARRSGERSGVDLAWTECG